jgi:hypothetical protein
MELSMLSRHGDVTPDLASKLRNRDTAARIEVVEATSATRNFRNCESFGQRFIEDTTGG